MKDNRDIETSFELAAFVAELRRLADELEASGSFSIELDGEMVEVPAGASFSVEHEREDGAEELEFQLKWGVKVEDEDEGDDAPAEDHAEAADAPADADAPIEQEALTEEAAEQPTETLAKDEEKV
ncbi:amphi-Trp domain-containing protein [Paracoccus laeviglucosivorans]|uniref:Amphi-Trp domain-containing protein n=1 Tax=Paracoccus laeviglucosivorans TaxID=1197861 RepID=A0A521E9S1_9RHOB|nr:amphi-Trp domain-containing protein [Paracoccus laeviglucosivorans]SMO80512.1 amphi-Trp domain-containing protein [Paracoccus laeviglucosivorans]